MEAFQRSEEARNFAFPRRIAPPQVVRYGTGKGYGAHVDAAYMAVGRQPLRSDLSSTLFISGPAEYGGGELGDLSRVRDGADQGRTRRCRVVSFHDIA